MKRWFHSISSLFIRTIDIAASRVRIGEGPIFLILLNHSSMEHTWHQKKQSMTDPQTDASFATQKCLIVNQETAEDGKAGLHFKFEFIGVLRHIQRCFSYIHVCDGTDVQADWRRSCTYGRAPTAIDIS